MRYLILLFLFILAIAVLVGISQLYLADPILIRYGQWQAEPSVGVVLAFLLTAFLSLVVIFKVFVKIISLPFHFSKWRQQSSTEKQQQKLRAGLRALTLGNEKESLKIFSLLVKDKNDDPGVYGLLAAMSAKRMGDTVQYKSLLKQATASKDSTISALANATLIRQENRFVEAINTINATKEIENHSAITELLLDINRELNNWEQALNYIYRLRDEFPARNWDTQIKSIISKKHNSSENAEELIIWFFVLWLEVIH